MLRLLNDTQISKIKYLLIKVEMLALSSTRPNGHREHQLLKEVCFKI